MPIIQAQGKTITCPMGANLRRVLLDHQVDLYNGKAKYINCHSLGTCGTCAVKIEGKVSSANWKDKSRCSLPPHSPESDLRLACQTQVLGDIKVSKFDRFWGQGEKQIW